MDERTDIDLIYAARAGDKAAFGQLAERHLAMTRRVTQGMISNREVAKELAQEAILQAYLSLNRLRETERFTSWLYGIARNVCRNHLRSQKLTFSALDNMRDDAIDEHLLRARGPNPQQFVEDREMANLVREAVANLSTGNRAATELFYFEELRISEVAVRLGISVNAVKGRLYQSRKQLQQVLTSVDASVDIPLVDKLRTRVTQDGQIERTRQDDKRKQKMVTITDVRALEVEDLNPYAVLFLLDKSGSRGMPLWVGTGHAHYIECLQRKEMSGVDTYNLMGGLLDVLGGNLQSVRIEALMKYHVFYAVAAIQQGEAVHELDAHPLHAIALALHTDSPILVADDVMAHEGQDLPQPFDEERWLAQEAEKLAQVYRNGASVTTANPTLTQRARQAWVQASSEALALNHDYVGTEHLLLGLMRDEAGISTRVLGELGVTPAHIDAEVANYVGRGASPPQGEPILAPRVASVLDLATQAQQELGHAFVGTEHLLLGIVNEGNGAAINVLRNVGVAPEQLKARLFEVFKPASEK